MGTIYMKASLSDVTIENIHQYNFNSLESYEKEQICSNENLRTALLTTDIDRNMQYFLNYHKNLTLEECMLIVDNSNDLWDNIGAINDFSTEFLMSRGEKLSKLSIEDQPNITPEFVIRYQNNLSLSRIFHARLAKGDIDDFLITTELCQYYIRHTLNWRFTKEQTLDAVNRFSSNEEQRNDIRKLVDTWYDTPVSRERLVQDYEDQERANHSVSAVCNYWDRNSKQPKYNTWYDYVIECKSTGQDGLADTWFTTFCRDPLLEIINID